MTHSQALEKFICLLQVRNLSPGTQQIYSNWIERFLKDVNPSDVSSLTPCDAQNYFIADVDSEAYASSTFTTLIFALRYFYESVLCIPLPARFLPKPLHRNPAPTPCFTDDQVRQLIFECPKITLKAAIQLACDCGLRCSEIVNIRFSDIDKASSAIWIRNSKRNKTRKIRYSPSTRDILNEYYCFAFRASNPPKPDDFLFIGKKPGSHLSSSSLTQQFKKYIQTFSFYLPGHRFHSLRHSFATQMVKRGCSLFVLKAVLGHASIASTAKYVHLQEEDLIQLGSPCDTWKGES